MLREDVVLMFSGGVDSTTSALDLLQTYRRLHLVTYANGYGHLLIHKSKVHVRDLRREYGAERILHEIISCRGLFERITINTLAEDYRAYGGGFIWCVGCKLAMNTMTIEYALNHGIPDVAEGVSPETNFFAEQTPEMVAALHGLYAEYGLHFLTPVYQMGGRRQQIARMRSAGMTPGLTWGHRNPGGQPLCLPGNALNILDTLFKVHPRHDSAQLTRYIRDKLVICRAYLAEQLGPRAVRHAGAHAEGT